MRDFSYISALLAIALLGSLGAQADSFTYNFDPTNTFSGTAPAGSLTATFSDLAANEVQLVITSNLASGENLDPNKALYLNIDPAHSALLSTLGFALTANTGFSEAATVMTGEDAFKADGTGGNYDILFTYAPATKAFTNGESQTYLITGTGLNADDFQFLSSGGSPSWYAAVHVQNTPAGGAGSAWVGGTITATPEPSSIVFLLFSSTLIGYVGLRRRRNAAPGRM